MKVHVLRVQGPSRRYWWVQGHHSDQHLKSYNSLHWTLLKFQKMYNRQIDRIVKYKGICSPAEAAMTIVEVTKKD